MVGAHAGGGHVQGIYENQTRMCVCLFFLGGHLLETISCHTKHPPCQTPTPTITTGHGPRLLRLGPRALQPGHSRRPGRRLFDRHSRPVPRGGGAQRGVRERQGAGAGDAGIPAGMGLVLGLGLGGGRKEGRRRGKGCGWLVG